MAKRRVKSKRIINCQCTDRKSYTSLHQNDNCICYIGTSMSNIKKMFVKRVNVTKVDELSEMELGVGT